MNTSVQPLTTAILDLAQDWVDHPFGEAFDSGHCESEHAAGSLRRYARESDSDQALADRLTRYIQERESYDDFIFAGAVRQALTNAGFLEPPPAPPKPAEQPSSLLKRLFRRG